MRGIDVSHHQGEIDWKKVNQSGIGFVIMKAMFENGHSKESAFERNYAGAAGLRRGVYLYSIATTREQAESEAADFCRILNGRPLEYGVWLDMEDNNKQRWLTKQALTEIIDTEARIISASGYPVGIYSNRDWYNNVLNGKGLALRYDFWIARYPKDDNGTIKDGLAPRGWAKIWQYSSKGRVPEINGNCDLDIEMADIPDDKKTGNPYPVPKKTMKAGSKGNDVRWLQYELNQRGAGLIVDGIFGLKTDTAVRKYQESRNLVVDGIVGSRTRAELENGK